MKNVLSLTIMGIIFLSFFSCQPSKAALAAAKEKAEIAKAAAKAEAEAIALADAEAKEQQEISELEPIDSLIFENLVVVQKQDRLMNLKIRIDSLSFGADIPDEIVITPSGRMKTITNRKSNFVVNQYQDGKILKVNENTKEIFVSCKDSTKNVITLTFGGVKPNDFTFNSKRGGDTIVLGGVIYPYSFGKGSSKIYLIHEKEEGKNIENKLTGEKYTPIKLKKE